MPTQNPARFPALFGYPACAPWLPGGLSILIPLTVQAACSYDLNGVGYDCPSSSYAAPSQPAYNANYYYQQQMLMRQRMIQQQQYYQQQQIQQQQLLQQQQAEQQKAQEEAAQQEAARKAQFMMDRDATAASLKGGFDDASGSGLKSGTDAALPALKSGHDNQTAYGSNVTNATHVTSGLPKFVEDSIPHTPAGDRVRKGFEAVQLHDWKVALAWFEDAHNHAPHDAGIARLVDLARFTLNEEIRTPAEASAPLSRHLDEFDQNHLSQHSKAQLSPEKQTPAPTTAKPNPNQDQASGFRRMLNLLKSKGGYRLDPPQYNTPAVAAVRG